jgi:hypothetical protein
MIEKKMQWKVEYGFFLPPFYRHTERVIIAIGNLFFLFNEENKNNDNWEALLADVHYGMPYEIN